MRRLILPFWGDDFARWVCNADRKGLNWKVADFSGAVRTYDLSTVAGQTGEQSTGNLFPFSSGCSVAGQRSWQDAVTSERIRAAQGRAKA
jgi:hypothetical protein